jgi:hypothetical protein
MFSQAWAHVLHRQEHRRRCQEVVAEVEEEEPNMLWSCGLLFVYSCAMLQLWDNKQAHKTRDKVSTGAECSTP